jgi:aryl-alcohol dehydrogenase-like predicted oxidoreductase
VGATRGQVVLAWLLSQDIRPMLGGSRVGQLDEALDGVALKLPAEHLERLDAADRYPFASPYPKV